MTTIGKILAGLGTTFFCVTLALPLLAQDDVAAAQRVQRECDDGRGDADACAQYGHYLYNGIGTGKDHAAALRVSSVACEKGHAQACGNAGVVLRWSDSVAPDLPQALTWFERGCELRQAASCVQVGYMRRDGLGSLPNAVLAREAFGRACADGNGEGCRMEGRIYADGLGDVRQNEGNAINSFRAGCSAGDMESCALVAYMAYNGRGMIPDAALAVREYMHACDGGIDWACGNLEGVREAGPDSFGYAELVTRETLKQAIPADLPLEQRYLLASAIYQAGNIPVALAAFEDLAAAGLGDANYQLGFIYYDGQGVPMDRPRAVRYFDRAANDGHPYAKFIAAQFYHSGTMVDRNEVWSIALMRSAAEAGIAEAEPIWREWQAAMDARYEARDAQNRQMEIDNEESQRAADAANMSRIRDLYSSGQNQQDNEQVCGMVYRNNQANQECMARETFDKYYNPAYQ